MMTNSKVSRRKFITETSAGVAALAFMSTEMLSGCQTKSENMTRGKIGIQLYTVRDQIAKDIKGTLQKVADIGFEGVEAAFWPEGVSVKDGGKFLEEAGLKVFSAHCEIPVGENQAKALEMAEVYGCKKLVWHGWPEDQRYKTHDGIHALADLYNEASAFAKSHGLQFGIHNHWWEFHNKVDGQFAYEALLEHLDQDIFFEIDTYWVKSAGHDPAKIVADFGARAPLLHIKDGPAPYNDNLSEDTTPMVPVGTGSQDFPSIVKAANGNTEWMIVEMDRTSGDVFEAIQQSYNYLVGNKLATGKKEVAA